MNGSLERVRAVLHGDMPDRAPLYELFRNDAVISHFAGETLTVENASEVVFRAYAPAIDATRPMVRLPRHEDTYKLPDGRQERVFRWTVWTEHKNYPDSDSYAAAKRAELKNDLSWSSNDQASMDSFLASNEDHRRKLGQVFFFPCSHSVGLSGIYGEVGLENFSYHLADYPDIIEALLERSTERAVQWIEHFPRNHGIEAVMSGDDIAFKTGPMLSPAWFQKHYFHRMARITDAYHKRGIKVLFHSDGNLNTVLDGLVEAGIDGLNPIEILADMNVGDIHRRFPKLFMTGGIDVSQLLPHGTPQQVRDAVHRAIDEAEGRIMVGASTELHDSVPLENYLAMREAVLEHRCQ